MYNRASPLLRAACLVLLCLPVPSFAQIEMQVDHEGVYRRVVDIYKTSFFVENEKGKRERAEYQKTRFRPAERFADGVVQVDFGDARDPRTLKNNKMKAGKNSFEMTLRLTPDRDLDDCFYVLLFTSNGAMATFFDTFGSLRAGKTKELQIKMPALVDAVGSLHVFEKGREVRTNDSVAGRSLDEEYQALLRGFSAAPATELFKDTNHFPHRISRNGKLLATYRDDKTHKRLVVIDTETMATVQSKDIGEHDEYLAEPEWLNETTLLYLFEDELHSLDIVSGKTRKLYEPVKSISKVLDDGIHAITYNCEDFRRDADDYFVLIDCVAGKRVSLQTGAREDLNYLDAAGKFRMKRQYDKTVLSFKVRLAESDSWRDLDSFNAEPGISFRYSARDAVDQVAHVEGFAEDPNAIFITSNRGRDTYALYRYDLRQGKIVETVWEDPLYDVGGENDSPVWIMRKSDLSAIGVSYWRDRLAVAWFDPRFQEIQAAIEAALPALQHMPVSWDDNAESVVFRSFGDQNPGSYFLFNSKSRILRKLYDVNPALKGFELGSAQPKRVRARDGAEILCYLTLPPNWDGKPIPTIASIHGGPMVRDRLEFSGINQFFATRGFAVLEVNYRGSVGFGRKHKLDGLIGNLDTKPIDDIADATQALIAEGIAQPDKIAIIGGSWGGYSVYMSLARYPELFQCGVASAAPVSLKSMLHNDRVEYNRYGYNYWEEILVKQVADPGYMERASPINRVDTISRPVLIIQGELDWRVNKGQAHSMAAALKKAGKEYTLILYPEDGHGHGEFGWNHHLNETEAFLRRHLGL